MPGGDGEAEAEDFKSTLSLESDFSRTSVDPPELFFKSTLSLESDIYPDYSLYPELTFKSTLSLESDGLSVAFGSNPEALNPRSH